MMHCWHWLLASGFWLVAGGRGVLGWTIAGLALAGIAAHRGRAIAIAIANAIANANANARGKRTTSHWSFPAFGAVPQLGALHLEPPLAWAKLGAEDRR